VRFRIRILVAGAAIFAGGWLAGAHRAAAGPRAAAPPVAWVTVRRGDSLWSLGRRFASPGEDLRRWVYGVERLNGLAGAGLRPGERLALPVSRDAS
jgi:LysM repeat protein